MKKLERVVVVEIHIKFTQPFSCINLPMNVWHWITAISECVPLIILGTDSIYGIWHKRQLVN